MRAGGCSVQQSLTAEAVTVVKQALSLARRRGNAQVTPLHVASAMLGSPTGLLRAACRQSHSHPLQCKALELCFNVALNRLPTASSGALFAPHCTHPSLSNALVAALKRAQAHQRRGSVDTQQQPVLTLKIEAEQLLLSILDDPSVSRVMREAGFTSTQVKEKVEEAVSLQICSKSLSMVGDGGGHCNKSIAASPGVYHRKSLIDSEDEDVAIVMDTFVGQKRKNTVVVGEYVGVADQVVKKVMEKLERGDAPTPELRRLQFISLPLFSLKGMSEEKVEGKIVELRCLARSCFSRGVVFYLGDLKWVSEFLCSKEKESVACCYCPVRHMIMELRRLACGSMKGERIWLIAVATYKTFMKCKMTHPSLQSLWELHPLTISGGVTATITTTSLDLSLNLDSNMQAGIKGSKATTKNGEDEEVEEAWWRVLSGKLAKDEENVASTKRVNESTISTSTGTPLWFHCRHENQSLKKDDQEERVVDLAKKPSSDCSWAHNLGYRDRVLPFLTTPSPSSSISISSSGDPLVPNLIHTIIGWPVSLPRQRFPPKEYQFWKWEKPELLSNPNSSPNSASSSEAATEEEDPCLSTFKELNAEALGVLTRALEKKVPWQKGVLSEVASTVLRCRSGMRQRYGDETCTWLSFRGVDSSGKYAVSKELARLVFGSTVNCVVIGGLSSRTEDSTEDVGSKRGRDEGDEASCCSYFHRFAAAVGDNPHRVFHMEEVEQANRVSMVGIKRAMETGRVGSSGCGDGVSLEDAIVIFSCENFSSVSRASSPSSPPAGKKGRFGGKGKREDGGCEDKGLDVCTSVSLDLNIAIEEVEDDDQQEQESDIDIIKYVDKEIIFNGKDKDVI